MMHGLFWGMICLAMKSLLGPTNCRYHDLCGRYGIMPSIYVVFGAYEYTLARAVNVSTISGNGGLNHMAFPTN
jgi:hypothetical protein